LSVSLFDKTPMFTLISEAAAHEPEEPRKIQARLWDS
jgi:hypothetical protein